MDIFVFSLILVIIKVKSDNISIDYASISIVKSLFNHQSHQVEYFFELGAVNLVAIVDQQVILPALIPCGYFLKPFVV